jgi:hypothetical protein
LDAIFTQEVGRKNFVVDAKVTTAMGLRASKPHENSFNNHRMDGTRHRFDLGMRS